MKFITGFAFVIFICFVIHAPNVFPQDRCHSTISEIRNDSRFIKAFSDDYMYYSDSLLYCFYYENGRLKTEDPSIDKNGEILSHGLKKFYYENGKLKAEIQYKEDNREGLSRLYDENGWLMLEINYKNDLEDGIAKEYYENGKLKSEALFKAGKIEGNRKQYSEDGSFIVK